MLMHVFLKDIFIVFYRHIILRTYNTYKCSVFNASNHTTDSVQDDKRISIVCNDSCKS